MRHRLLRRLLVIATNLKTSMGRRHRFIQLDDRKYLRALRDVDRGRQARHKWDLEAAHRLVFVLATCQITLSFFTGKTPDVPGTSGCFHFGGLPSF
jgi:hypothetical protein